jgi:hypothetical protein
VANAFYYNNLLAMASLRQRGAAEQLFGLWLSMIHATNRGGEAKHFRRAYDKKARARAQKPTTCRAAAPGPSCPAPPGASNSAFFAE